MDNQQTAQFLTVLSLVDEYTSIEKLDEYYKILEDPENKFVGLGVSMLKKRLKDLMEKQVKES